MAVIRHDVDRLDRLIPNISRASRLDGGAVTGGFCGD